MTKPEAVRIACRELFLEKLEELGHITMACEAVGISRRTAYRWRDEDPEFEKAWTVALRRSVEALEDEAVRRARFGVSETVYFQGAPVGTIQRYSDGLLTTLLKAKKPAEYRERSDVNVSGSLDLRTALANATLEQLEELRQKLLEESADDLV